MPESFHLRKIWVLVEETTTSREEGDGGQALRKVAACAVVRNPLAGAGFVEDLSPLIGPSQELGALLGGRAAAVLEEPVESYGRAAICGMGGEQEHANACLTSTFGDSLRQAIGGGRAWITSTTKLGGAGAGIDVPLAFKDELWVRSHYDALEVGIPDAPATDELVVIVAVANRRRLNARLGGMTKEMALAQVSQG